MKKVTHYKILKQIKKVESLGFRKLTIVADDFNVSSSILKKLKSAGFNTSLYLEKNTNNLVFSWKK